MDAGGGYEVAGAKSAGEAVAGGGRRVVRAIAAKVEQREGRLHAHLRAAVPRPAGWLQRDGPANPRLVVKAVVEAIVGEADAIERDLERHAPILWADRHRHAPALQ